MEEAKLVSKAKEGDVTAYEGLVRLHQQLAFRTAYLITGDAVEAEDAAQEAFVKAYRSLKRFRSGAPFRPWLLTIVANEARNRHKARGRRAALVLRAAAEAHLGGGDPSPESSVVASERRTALLGAVATLREEDRLTIAFRYFLGLSEAETAGALGCARGTVKSRLSRAIGRLRERMAEEEDVIG